MYLYHQSIKEQHTISWISRSLLSLS